MIDYLSHKGYPGKLGYRLHNDKVGCKSCPFPLVSKMPLCHVHCHSPMDYSFNQFHLFKATPRPLRDYLKSSPLAPNPSPHCVQSAPADQLAASCLLLTSPAQPNLSLGLIFTFTRVNLMLHLGLAGLSSRVSWKCFLRLFFRFSLSPRLDWSNNGCSQPTLLFAHFAAVCHSSHSRLCIHKISRRARSCLIESLGNYLETTWLGAGPYFLLSF